MNKACQKIVKKWNSCRQQGRCEEAREIKSPVTHDKIARAYRKYHQATAKAELDFYAKLSSLKEAVKRASRAERPDGKRHDHQTRTRRTAIRKVEKRLQSVPIRNCRTFAELFIRGSGRANTL